jgi:alpha-L-rhamnosidase
MKIKLLFVLFLAIVSLAQSQTVPFNGNLDPARDAGKLHRLAHQELKEQYIWTANDAAALRPDHAKFIYRDRDRKTEPHVFRGWFTVDRLPQFATLYIAGPRRVRAYLNGKLVLEQKTDTDSPLNTHVFLTDVQSSLRVGRNLLAIEAIRGYGIVAASDSPVVQQVAYGETLVAKIVAARAYTDGQELATTNADWHSTLEEADGWQSPAFNDQSWPVVQSLGPIESSAEFFQWNLDAGMYDWPGYIGMSPYLRSYDLVASAVTHRNGGLAGVDALTAPSRKRTFVVSVPAIETDPKDTPSLMLDFSREVSGRLLIESACNCEARVEVSYGESEQEALTGLHYLGRNVVTVPAHGMARGPKSAFRYVWLRFVEGAPKTAFRSLRLEGIAYPVRYEGEFESSDVELNRIWETAAYTAHLCMQDGIWDAPKRDRGRWMGDLDTTGPVITSIFGDYSLLDETLTKLIPPTGEHVNGIPGYTALWITTLADLYLRSGDKRALKQKQAKLLRLLQQMDHEFDSSGRFLNVAHRWLFVDWSPDLFAFTDQASEGTAFEMVRGYERGAWLLKELGDERNADRYEARVTTLRDQLHGQYADQAGRYGSTLQLNAMAVLSGVAKASDYEPMWETTFAGVRNGNFQAPTISPYFNSYVLDAMAEMGHRGETLNWLRSYWGGMLAEGATSFWEAYDPRWPKDNPHASLQADGKTGYFVSLAHGWSSSPAKWLQEEVLGVRPVAPGYSEVEIRPNLMGLEWINGAVATPHGPIKVRATERSVIVQLPAGVSADLTLPEFVWEENGHLVRSAREGSIEGVSKNLCGPGTFHFSRQ